MKAIVIFILITSCASTKEFDDKNVICFQDDLYGECTATVIGYDRQTNSYNLLDCNCSRKYYCPKEISNEYLCGEEYE